MKKISGLSFAVWINWIFFGLFFILSVLTLWAILGQQGTSFRTMAQEIFVLLIAAVLPAALFLINAISIKRLSNKNELVRK